MELNQTSICYYEKLAHISAATECGFDYCRTRFRISDESCARMVRRSSRPGSTRMTAC